MMPSLPKYIYVVAGFIGLVLVTNLLLLDYFFIAQRNDLLDFQTRLTQLSESFKLLGGRLLTAPTGGGSAVAVNPTSNNTSCPMSCVGLITMATISAKPAGAAVITAPTSTTTTTSAKGEYFIPLGSGSVSQTNNWTDITTAQAAFDTSNYGNIKNAYFEVFARVLSGEVHVRLFDVTSPAIIWGSEVLTTSNSSVFLSAPISLTSGQKTYRVQMYSTISTGTLDQARIRVVTQ